MSCFDHRETRRPALRGAASISFRELVSGLDDVDATTVRLLRLDQKLMVPVNPGRMANLLNVTAELLRGFLAHLSKPDDETATFYADGRAVEIPVF